jgi:hypothetical protein
MTTPTTDIVSYSGWVRQGRGRWRLFCRGASAECVLADMLDRCPAGVDKLVRQGSEDPNEETTRRPRRCF